MAEEQWVLAIDIGGTFTDLVLLDCRTGRQSVAKVPTTYPDPSDAVLSGIDSLPDFRDAGAVQRVIHGTTLVTNTLIERKGARTGLITTAGFRDALEIGREGRYDIYDLRLELPEPLVERRLRFGALERMNVRGEAIQRLDESSIREACSTFIEEEVESVAICFLHAYANPEHERQAARIVGKAMPGVSVSVSHQVSPEQREYDRTSTTVANAYVQPLARRYLSGLTRGLEAKGIAAPLHIMLSNGGVCSAETAAAFPVRLVESGPSGGALSAAYWGGRSSLNDVLAFDMGGTTAKAVLGSDGVFPVTTESEVARVYRFKRGSGLPLLVPVLDMIEIGAGGGSIAHLNEMGLPAVGPESAGSVPGPACYGNGGSAPTVTDADLVLGMLNPAYFLGGKMALNLDRANSAVHRLSKRLGTGIDRMAWGIHRMVNENMANAARVHAAERGIDIRGYAMVATGGAGPVHACGVAERLGIRTVIVPPTAGVSSAFGLMLAPISFDFARSYVARLEALNYARLNTLFEAMETEGAVVLRDAGVAPSQMRIERTADMRYVGQGHEIRIPIPGGRIGPDSLDEIHERFDTEYVRKFTRTCEGVEIESVHWRVRMSGPKPDIGDPELPPSTGGDAVKGVRPVLFDAETGPEPAPVFDRYRIDPGFRATGPAIVEEDESTAVVPHGWSFAVETCGSLLLTRVEGLG